MTRQELIYYIRWLANKAGSQKALAAKLNVSPAYLGDVIHGRREPGAKLLTALHVKSTTTYEHINPETDWFAEDD